MVKQNKHDLLSRQVTQLYALAPIGIIASLVNGPILTFILWGLIPSRVLLSWLFALVVLNGLWIGLWSRFQKAAQGSFDPQPWNRKFLAGTLASGLLWGAVSIVAFPETSIPHQLFLAFVLGGMIAGATAVYAALPEAFLAYMVPTIIPLLIRFFSLGDELHVAMGGMSLLFVALMYVTVYHNHTVTISSMRLSLELIRSNQLLQTQIQERQQAETALRESQEQLLSVMQSTDDGIISLNKEGQVILWNKGAEHLFGLSAEDMQGQLLARIIPARFRRAHQAGIQRAARAGKIRQEGERMELTGLRRDGSEFPLELSLGYWVRHQDIFFTGIVRDITARKQDEDALHRREWELQQSQEELQALGARLISAQEDERRRLARDLHDDMSQRLMVVLFEIQSLREHLAETDPMQETLTSLNDQVSVLSDNVRQLAHQLHPSILDDLGLEVALQSVVQEFSKWSQIAVTFRPRNVPSNLSPDTSLCLYRVTQECLRNVARHAQASHVSVEVTGLETGLQLVITDNGRGFTPEAVRRGTHGLGLIGIKERIRAVKGTIEVNASIGQGTSITVWIPLLAET